MEFLGLSPRAVRGKDRNREGLGGTTACTWKVTVVWTSVVAMEMRGGWVLNACQRQSQQEALVDGTGREGDI